MKLFTRITLFFSLVIIFVFPMFNGCSGVASGRHTILDSTHTNIPIAPFDDGTGNPNAPNLQVPTSQTPPPPPPDPEKFHYFPYDLQLDTIAFLPCEREDFALGFLKAGAYFNRSGLRLSEYFLKKQEQGLSDSQLEDLIKESTTHRAYAQVAITFSSNFAYPLALDGTVLKAGISSFHKLNQLIPELISSGTYRIRKIAGQPIQASIQGYTTFYPEAIMNNNLRFVLAYSNNNEGFPLHKPDDSEIGRDIYGRVYELDFEKIRSGRYALDSIEETRFPMDSSQAGWICPDKLRLEVRRHPYFAYQRDIDEQYLDSNNFEKGSLRNDEELCSNSSSGGAALDVVRSIFGTSARNWNININDRCISLNDTNLQCYRHNLGGEYNEHRDRVDFTEDCDSGDALNYCPRFLSICIRKN